MVLIYKITERYNKTINTCSELEKEVLALNQEKNILQEKTLKYDQLLDQKRRIEEIIDQMKSKEVILYAYLKLKFRLNHQYLLIIINMH